MIVESFNLPHVLTIVIIPVLIFLVLNFSLQKRNDKAKRTVLLLICVFNILLYISYKIVQSNTPEYNFNILTNLPLHFCNINLILLPLAILIKNKFLLAYQVYFGIPLASLALLTIDPAFRGKELFEFTCLVYFYYHSMLVVLPVLLIKFKLFTPSFKVVWQPAVLMVSLTAAIHVVNLIFRTTGLAPEANYFFTYGLKGDFFTDMLWQIVPYNFFFLLPAILLFMPYIILLTLPFHLAKHKKKHNAENHCEKV